MEKHVYGNAVPNEKSDAQEEPVVLTDRERQIADLIKRELVDQLQRCGALE